MIPYDIDPSLHAVEPELPRLDDGFSPRHHGEPDDSARADATASFEQALASKSDF